MSNQSRHDLLRATREELRTNATRQKRHSHEPTQQTIGTHGALEDV